MKKWNQVVALLLMAASMLTLAGCQSTASTDAGKANSKPVKKVIIGTGSKFKNYCFIDDKNNLTGFEVELLKKVDEKLPQYEFEFKTFDFAAILVSLETGKIDLAAHQYEVNADRKNKFLFGDEGVTTFDLRLVVKEDRNDIKSLDDLAAIGGKVEVGSAAANSTYVVDKWNKEHGNKLNLVFQASDTTLTLKNLESGKTDAFVSIQRSVDDYQRTFGAKIKTVGEPISRSNSYYLYRKNDPEAEQLKKDVDAVLKELKADGTVSELSKKWLGGDYVPKN